MQQLDVTTQKSAVGEGDTDYHGYHIHTTGPTSISGEWQRLVIHRIADPFSNAWEQKAIEYVKRELDRYYVE